MIDQVCDQFQDVGGGGGVSGNTTSTGLCEADAKAQATSCLHVALRKFAREFVVAGEKVRVYVCAVYVYVHVYVYECVCMPVWFMCVYVVYVSYMCVYYVCMCVCVYVCM